MSVRDRGATSLSAPRPSAQARHLRRGAGLVDEDEPRGIELRLRGRPALAPRDDVGPGLLGGVRRFF